VSTRTQVAISAASAPASAFIALNRLATGQPWWAALWIFVGATHVWMLVDAVRDIRRQRARK
jgi:hypothetical protein